MKKIHKNQQNITILSKRLFRVIFIFVFTSTSLFNSFSKFYCKFTCPLDARSRFVAFMFIFFSRFFFFVMFQLFYDPLTRIIIVCVLSTFQIDYLRSYGYLEKTNSRFGADILHEDTATNALRALQVSLVTCSSSWFVDKRNVMFF